MVNAYSQFEFILMQVLYFFEFKISRAMPTDIVQNILWILCWYQYFLITEFFYPMEISFGKDDIRFSKFMQIYAFLVESIRIGVKI